MQRAPRQFHCFLKYLSWYGVACVGMFLSVGLHAEVVRDGKIGPDLSIQPTGPDFQIPETLGELRGRNLFHSFAEFSLSQDQSATFSGTGVFDNIIARVTGPNVSTIDGLLRATVSADLYLMNPRGILFGPNAQLDLYGAFHGSTAERLEFTNGEVFAAAPDGGTPLLSVATPTQFGFLSPSAAQIKLQGSKLTSAHDVTLSAGSIAFSDGAMIITATDRSDAGASVTLFATERIEFSGTGEDGAGAGLDAGSRGEGAAGTVRVEAPVVELRDGAVLSTNTAGAGYGGALLVTAGERVTLGGNDRNGASSSLQAQSLASGDAGMLRIKAPVIELQDGAQFTSVAHGSGSGGELLVTATDRFTLSGKNQEGLGASLQAGTTATSTGQGGTLRVEAPLIDLRNGARMTTSAEGAGRGGDLFVTARDRVTLSGTDAEGSGARLQANARGVGDAGAIQVTASVIALQDGAAMEANMGGGSTGRGGNLTVTATEQLTLSGTDSNGFGSSLQAIANGEGLGGTLRVAASVIELRDGAFLTANSAGAFGASTPGTPEPDALDSNIALVVRADQRLTLSGTNGIGQGSRIETNALELSQGRAILIEAPVTQLTDGASISSASFGTAAAGAIRIRAEESLELSGGSQITSSSETTSGGSIALELGGVLRLRDSRISTRVGSGDGGAGGIDIAQTIVVLDRSNVTSSADRGEGGRIQITADSILKSSDSIIDASAGPQGIDGEIVTRSPDTNPTSKLQHADMAFLNASALLRPRCDARADQTTGQFRVARQQGLPLSPEDVLMAFDARDALPRETGGPDLNVLAATAFRGGRFEQAGDYWTQVSERAQLDGDAHVRGAALRGVAESQQARGLYVESVQTLETALDQAATAQDESGLSAVQGQLGNAYLALGEVDAAEPLLREAIERAVAANENASAATLLNNLGNLHMVRQRYDDAVRAYTTGIHHAERAGEAVQRAKTLSNAARAVLEQGQSDSALALLNQARAAAQILPLGHDKIAVLIHTAKTAERLSEVAPATKRAAFAAAYAGLRDAVQLSRELEDTRSLSYALGNLGRLYQRERRFAEALYLTRLAEQAAEEAGAPEALYRWHWQAGQVLWAQGEVEATLQSYRRAVAILEDSRQETLAQYGAAAVRFQLAVAPVYEDLVDVLLQRAAHLGDEDEGMALLLEARATIEQFKAAELRDYFRDECVIDLEAKSTRLEAVAENVAVIYPIVLPGRLELLVSLPSGLKRYTVPVDAVTLWETVRQFRKAVETLDREARVRRIGESLYEWLVQPVVPELGGVDTLVFVPGGALRTVPLAAMHDGEDYLTRRFRVVVTSGLSLIDPKPLDRAEAKFVMAGLSVPVQEFWALPAVSRELEAVQDLHGGRVLLDADFTSVGLKRLLEKPVSVLHIASHAQFTGDDASSFLLTYDGRLSMAALDEILRVTRFRDRPLELLVLSACDTANGDERAALGLVGVGIKAGARSAIGSLWAIDDDATAELVTAFYRELKNPAVSKAGALQAAQGQLLGDSRYAHPYYWSAFVLVNNWL